MSRIMGRLTMSGKEKQARPRAEKRAGGLAGRIDLEQVGHGIRGKGGNVVLDVAQVT